MTDKNSKVPIFIAILVAVILVAAGGYYMLGGKSPSNSKDEKKANDNLDNSGKNPDNSESYYFVSKGSGVIEIFSKSYSTKTALAVFNDIDSGLSELRLKCMMASREPLMAMGTTIGWSVIVVDTDTCNVIFSE